MPGRLEGKIALVSGSTQGFGRGILETFIREGAVVLGMDLQATDGPVDGYPEHQAYQIKANVAEEQSWKKAVRLSDNPPKITDSEWLMQRFSSSRLRSPSSETHPPSLSTMPDGHTRTSPVSMSPLKSLTASLM